MMGDDATEQRPRKHPRLTSSAPAPASASGDSSTASPTSPTVSVIIAVFNAASTLDACFEGLIKQTYQAKHTGPHSVIEISLFDDASTDGSEAIYNGWKRRFVQAGFGWVSSRNASASNLGPGGARNRAIAQSSGSLLCIHDADDVSYPERVELQVAAARARPWAIVGCEFDRVPEGSTASYTSWHNALSAEELELQQYREVTIVQPTWVMHRSTFEAVGGYRDAPGEEFSGPDDRHYNRFGLCEDLKFFFAFLELTEARFRTGEIKERLFRVPKKLVCYRHVAGSMSAQTPRRVLLRVRVKAFERRVLVLERWKRFSIWGAGRDGKQFFNELSSESQLRVRGFCDIDEKKIQRGYHHAPSRRTLPVVPFKDVQPPFVVCVAKGRTAGQLEANVETLGLTEGVDFYYFT